jgi:hypothetical protein
MAKTMSLYGVHPSVTMVQNWRATLKDKTGRSLDEWIALVRKSAPKGEKERRDWLREKHGFGTFSAMTLLDHVETGTADFASAESYLAAADRYVDAMFYGPKAALRPIYDALLDIGLAIAPDVKACPCQTIVPLYRNHVFAQIKPTTRTRIDMGFALGALPAEGRLIDTGGYAKKDRITHRIPICSLDDIDREVRKWMKTAYDLDK